MRRILFTILWLTIAAFIVQIIYFVFFQVKGTRYHAGQPLTTTLVGASVPAVSTLFSDRHGTIWLGTDGHGIYRLDAGQTEPQKVTVPNELNTDQILCLAIDQQGRLWAGTSRKGLFIQNGDEWKHYTFAARIGSIAVSRVDGNVVLGTQNAAVCYESKTDVWSVLPLETGICIQPTGLCFDTKNNLYVGTACHGVFRLERDGGGYFRPAHHSIAKRRFGTNVSANLSPVPLDPCGEGLPSNQVNAVCVTSDGTLWAATAAGLSWSRDSGDTWFFLRGCDYGDKIRGLLNGTPHGWKEISRVRFGELLPEDDISLLTEDANGILWVAARTLGCIAIRPNAFYQKILPKNGQPETISAFLEAMGSNSVRFYGTKTGGITAMAPRQDGKVFMASRSGTLEMMEYPASSVSIHQKKEIEEYQHVENFPAEWKEMPETVGVQDNPSYPYSVFCGDDVATGIHWEGQYGESYTLIGGGEMPLDKLLAFDESLCRIRPFAGYIGNRTRPVERVTLPAHVGHDGQPLTVWNSTGVSASKTMDGQHLWLEVKLNQPGLYDLTLCFIDPDADTVSKTQENPRDYLVEVFSEPVHSKTRLPKGDWSEFGRLVDEMATLQEPLSISRVIGFRDAISKQFVLAGPGVYYVKTDKNYSRCIDLCAVFIDRRGQEKPTAPLPEMNLQQTPDKIP